MEQYYIYHYYYNDVRSCRHITDTATLRKYDDVNIIELTKHKSDHLEPAFETNNADEALCVFEMVLMEHLDDFVSVYDFNNKIMWDLYRSNLKETQQSIQKLTTFHLLDRLQVNTYDTQTYVRNTLIKDENHKNKYIYFLKRNDEIVYVGQTQATELNKCIRPNQHTDKLYDSFDMIQLDDEDDINVVEAFYIMKHKPFYNKALSVDREMLSTLKYIFKTDWDPYKNRK